MSKTTSQKIKVKIGLSIKHSQGRVLNSMASKLDQLVTEAERCGRDTKARKDLLSQADDQRERMLLLESDRDFGDVISYRKNLPRLV